MEHSDYNYFAAALYKIFNTTHSLADWLAVKQAHPIEFFFIFSLTIVYKVNMRLNR